MSISPVNNSKCSQIPDKKIKSVWSCLDEIGCGFQMWNTRPVNYYIEDIQRSFDKKYLKMDDSDLVKIIDDLNAGAAEEKNNG